MSEYSNYEISLLAGTRRGRKIIVVFWKNSERLCSEFRTRMLYQDSNIATPPKQYHKPH